LSKTARKKNTGSSGLRRGDWGVGGGGGTDLNGVKQEMKLQTFPGTAGGVVEKKGGIHKTGKAKQCEPNRRKKGTVGLEEGKKQERNQKQEGHREPLVQGKDVGVDRHQKRVEKKEKRYCLTGGGAFCGQTKSHGGQKKVTKLLTKKKKERKNRNRTDAGIKGRKKEDGGALQNGLQASKKGGNCWINCWMKNLLEQGDLGKGKGVNGKTF